MFCTSSSTSTSSIQEAIFPYLYDIRSDCATTTITTTKENDDEDDDGGDDPDGEKDRLHGPNVLCDCCLKCY